MLYMWNYVAIYVVASANIITIHSFHCLIALQLRLVLSKVLSYTLFCAEGVSLAVMPYVEKGLPALMRLLPSIHTLGRILLHICSYARKLLAIL